MAGKTGTENSGKKATHGMLKVLILVISCLLAFACLVLPDILSDQSESVSIGQVAPQEITAPYYITFESKVLTDQARNEASAAVEQIFLPADTSIAKAQLETLSNALYFFILFETTSFNQQQKLNDMRSDEKLTLKG
jgi:membrane-associated HD superfamily phosphohydrolase